MLPAIPDKLWKIDESTVGEHFSLRDTDQCYYIWEYTAGRRYDFSPANQLISNLKIKPSQIAISPRRDYYKQQAIGHAAAGLRHLLPKAAAQQRMTFVPVPGSKAADHPDFDTRMLQVLRLAFQGWAADIRPMLELDQSTLADHETLDRLPYDELLAISKLNNFSENSPRPIVVIVDDVLNSGKHFRVAKALISGRFPDAEIRGLFLARCVRDSPVEDFENIDDA